MSVALDPDVPETLFDALIDTIDSLTCVMEQESEAIALRGRSLGGAELAAAKSGLVDQLEGGTARLFRQSPGWIAALPLNARERLTIRVGRLRDAAAVNAGVLGGAAAPVDIERQSERRSDV